MKKSKIKLNTTYFYQGREVTVVRIIPGEETTQRNMQNGVTFTGYKRQSKKFLLLSGDRVDGYELSEERIDTKLQEIYVRVKKLRAENEKLKIENKALINENQESKLKTLKSLRILKNYYVSKQTILIDLKPGDLLPIDMKQKSGSIKICELMKQQGIKL